MVSLRSSAACRSSSAKPLGIGGVPLVLAGLAELADGELEGLAE